MKRVKANIINITIFGASLFIIMSQPVAIFAKIPLTEKSFKSFMRTAPVKQLAAFIFDTLNQPGKNFYVFRYLKKEQVLFAYFYFNYGPLPAASPVMAALQRAVTFADLPGVGYIAGMHDALNFDQADLRDIYQINGQQCMPVKEIPAADWQQLEKDIRQQFFKKVTGDFANEFYKGKIVDSAIVRKCKALAEKHRQEGVLKNLDTASFSQPLFFFDEYFFNGQYIYRPGGHVSVFKQLDAARFRQTPYGGTDGRYVVTGGKILLTDTASFKKMQQTELIYYKSAIGVYNEELQLIPEADPVTFKVVDDHHAVDANNIYFNHLVIAKASIGAYQFDTRGYFWHCIILTGERAVYVGREQIAVDPATFRVLRFPANIHYNHCLLAIAADKNGTMILYKPSPFDGPVQIIRNEDPDTFIQKIAAEINNRRFENNQPPTPSAYDRAFYESFQTWLRSHFDTYYPAHQLKRDFYIAINNYMHACFQEQQYEALLDIYEKVKGYAWLNPYIFHHTACTYVKLGQLDAAVAEVRKALVYGYDKLKDIWTDTDLEPIWQHAHFIELRRFAEANTYPFVTLEMLEAIAQLEPGTATTANIISHVADIMYFPDLPQVPDSVEDAALAARYARYRELLARIYEDYFMRGQSFGKERLYRVYRHHTALSPHVHADMLLYTFKDAHMFGRVDETKLTECLNMAAALKDSLARIADVDKREAVQKELERNTFFSFVLHDI